MLLLGDILPRDNFREDFQRGTEWVFFPSRDGPQLFRRDRSGTLRRQRIPQVLEFIDERRQLIAVCEDCAFKIHPLPCDWKYRYLPGGGRGSSGTVGNIEVSAFDRAAGPGAEFYGGVNVAAGYGYGEARVASEEFGRGREGYGYGREEVVRAEFY